MSLNGAPYVRSPSAVQRSQLPWAEWVVTPDPTGAIPWPRKGKARPRGLDFVPLLGSTLIVHSTVLWIPLPSWDVGRKQKGR